MRGGALLFPGELIIVARAIVYAPNDNEMQTLSLVHRGSPPGDRALNKRGNDAVIHLRTDGRTLLPDREMISYSDRGTAIRRSRRSKLRIMSQSATRRASVAVSFLPFRGPIHT